MKYKYQQAVTLIELLISIFLLGTVILTAITVELAVRRMNIKPTVQSQLLDELIPVVERIKKDLETQIGSLDNKSISIEDNGRRVVIRIDSDFSGDISSGDAWHSYSWASVSGVGPIRYSPTNSSLSYETIAEGITGFNAANGYDNTALTIQINTRKDPSKGENPLTNPAVNLTTTMFSRMASGN